jgi:hypothetical protein
MLSKIVKGYREVTTSGHVDRAEMITLAAVEQANIDSLRPCLQTENLRVGSPTEVAV